MILNVLLLTCRANSEEASNTLADHMPYGLGYIAATLKRYSRHNVWIIDVPHRNTSYEHLAAFIEDHLISVVGISAVVANYLFCVECTGFIKDNFPHITVVMGGALPTSMPDIIAADCRVDIIVRGPGEMAFLEIVNNLITFSSGPKIIEGWFPPSLEDIPWPDWEAMNFGSYSYLPPWSDFPIFSSRGCPYQCNYCYKINGSAYKERAIDDLYREVRHVTTKLNINHFMMQDDLFFAHPGRVHELCRRMVDDRLEVEWSAVSRIDLLDEGTIALLKEAGCKAIAVGVESGSEQMLKLMNKRLSLRKTRENIALLNRHQIRIMPYIIVGYPGETKETLAETENFLAECRLYSAMTYAFPLPETKLWKIALSRGMIGDIRAYLSRANFCVTEMHYNFTGMADEEFLCNVEEMKQRVLFSFIDSFLGSTLSASSKRGSFWIYGVGFLGRGVNEYLRKNGDFVGEVKGFIDDDPARQGVIIQGLYVYSLLSAPISGDDICIIANSYFPEVMVEKVKNLKPGIETVVLA